MTKLLQQCLDALLPHGSSHGNGWQAVEDAAIEALRQALAQQEPSNKMFDCEIAARPLRYSLHEYHIAPTKGPLNYTWEDKPHRLLYDLIAAVKYYAKAQQEQPASVDAYNGAREDVAIWKKPDYIASYMEVRPLVYAGSAPTQPALSESDMLKLYTKATGKHIKVKEEGKRRGVFRLMKAIEAHCRVGATS